MLDFISRMRLGNSSFQENKKGNPKSRMERDLFHAILEDTKALEVKCIQAAKLC